jgi:hypothetical protein
MRWVWRLLGCLVAIAVGLWIYLAQGKAVWTVTVPSYATLVHVDEQAGILLVDECDPPSMAPTTITKRSLATGEVLGISPRLEGEPPWEDGADCQVSAGQRYLAMTEGYRRDGRGVVTLHSLENGKLLREWSLDQFDRAAVTFSPDGKHLLLGCADVRGVDPNQLVVRIWEIGTGQERRLTMPRDHEEAIEEVLASEDLA